MANIKLKDLLKEVTIDGGVISRNPWIKEEDEKPQIDIKELVAKINNFGGIGDKIYGKSSLKKQMLLLRLKQQIYQNNSEKLP